MANVGDSSTVDATATKPIRGILKNTSSFDRDGLTAEKLPTEKEMKWDEMNILATYHPPDKDYGHIKIDEPPTPYNRLSDGEMEEGRSGDEEENAFNPECLADSLKKKTKPKILTEKDSSADEDDEGNLTEEEKARRKAFAKRRKLHYNEFYAVKLARELLNEEDDDDDDGRDNNEPSSAVPVEEETRVSTDIKDKQTELNND